jgi:hypothetical protein
MKYLCSVIVAVLLTAFSVSSVSAQVSTLTNADVIHLVGMGVSDATVIAVINEAKTTQFDLGALALANLTASRVSTAVITAMRQSSTPALAPSPNSGTDQLVTVGRPQTLAEAEAEAKKRPNSGGNWMLPASKPKPKEALTATKALTAAEAADLDRSKFDTVYSTGKAMQVAVLTRDFTEAKNAFDTAVQIARDKASTKAERALIQQYLDVSTKFDIWVLREQTSRLSREYVDTTTPFQEALDMLAAANAVYLRK